MGNLAGASLALLPVFQLNVPCVRQAQRMVKALTDRGVDSARILPVANRQGSKKAMVSMEDAGRAIGISSVAAVRNDYAAAGLRLDLGQTLSQAAPRLVPAAT